MRQTTLPPAVRLQRALRQLGLAAADLPTLEELTRVWLGGVGEPLLELDIALRQKGLVLPQDALEQVAWAILGVPEVGAIRLEASAAPRLTHLTELHDVFTPSEALRLAGQLAGEADLAPDLRRVRPWLALPEPVGALPAVFEAEWSGFLCLCGEFGPWAYVPSIADLQALSRRYSALVRAALGGSDASVLTAARRLQPPEGGRSLLARLESTDYRRSLRAAPQTPAPLPPDGLAALEEAFWKAAEQQARQRVAGRSSRRL